MTTSSSEAPTQVITVNPQDWLLASIRLWGLILLTLHLAAANLPEETSWSLWPYTFLLPWLGWALALLAGALIIPAVSHGIIRLAACVLRNEKDASRLTPHLDSGSPSPPSSPACFSGWRESGIYAGAILTCSARP
jgi:hypothetical protein